MRSSKLLFNNFFKSKVAFSCTNYQDKNQQLNKLIIINYCNYNLYSSLSGITEASDCKKTLLTRDDAEKESTVTDLSECSVYYLTFLL